MFPRFWEWTAEPHQGKKVGRMGYYVRLSFAKPVIGPVALGYAAHFGLGAMRPQREQVGIQRQLCQNADGISNVAV